MLPSEQVEQARSLVRAQDAARTAIAVQSAALAARAARSFSGWYDPLAITEWAAALVRMLEPLQVTLARSTDAYLAQVSSAITGRRVRPSGAIDVSSLRQGITHAGAYARATDAYRWQQSQWDKVAARVVSKEPGTPPTMVLPIEAAVQRVETVADLDAQLVTARQSQASMQRQSDLTGYRRVVHPEMSKGGTCGLCAAASTRLYGPRELMPIHARCACTTVPVYDHADVGAELNSVDLAMLYRHAGSTAGGDLKRTRYRVDEHGELGPVLTAEDAPIRKVADLPREPRRVRTPAERQAQVRRILAEQSTALPKVRELAAVDPAWSDAADQIEMRVTDLRRQLAA